MSNTTLNWNMRNVLVYLKDEGRLAVYLAYVLHADHRGRAYPSIDTLAKETGYGRTTVIAAKSWLLEHKALAVVPFEKRMGQRETTLHHRREVIEVTGLIKLDDGRIVELLYENHRHPDDDDSSADEPKNSSATERSPAEPEVTSVVVDPESIQIEESTTTPLEYLPPSEGECEGEADLEDDDPWAEVERARERDKLDLPRTGDPRLARLARTNDLCAHVSPEQLRAWIGQYGADRVVEVARWFCSEMMRGKAESGGWMRRALEYRWANPPYSFVEDNWLTEDERRARYARDAAEF